MITISFNTAAGAIAAIIKRRFLIIFYTEADTCRLRLDAALTTSDTTGAMKGAKNILIYDNIMHPLINPDPSKCGTCITARDRAKWAVTTLKMLEQFPAIKLPDDEEGHNEDIATKEGQIQSPDTKSSSRSEKHGNHNKQQGEGTRCTRDTTTTSERGRHFSGEACIQRTRGPNSY